MFALLNQHIVVSGRLILPLLALLTAGSALGAERNAETTIQISFSEGVVRASGISNGGDAIVFGCSISRASAMRKIDRHAEVVSDTDGDGAITLTVPKLSPVSVWAVVDFTTGRYAVAAPPGFEARPMDLPEHGWQGGRQFFDLRRDYLEVLVVRPGVGAWTLFATQGGPNDDDGEVNTVLRTRLERMKHLHGADAAPRPPVVVPRDLLLIIDPLDLDFFVSEAK